MSPDATWHETDEQAKGGAAPVQWLKHAFAIEPPGPAEPGEDVRELIERLCREIVRRRMTAPALMMLECSRPLQFVGSQALVFFAPLMSALFEGDGHQRLARYLEHRGSVEYLCQRIEQLDAERDHGPPTQTTSGASR